MSGRGPPNWSSGVPGPNRAILEVLRLSAAAVVADDDEQPGLVPVVVPAVAAIVVAIVIAIVVAIAVAAAVIVTAGEREAVVMIAVVAVAPIAVIVVAHLEPDDAAVVVAAERLAGVGLKRAQLDEVPLVPQRRAVPDEAVDAVAEERRARGVVRVDRRAGGIHRRALRPIQIHAGIAGEAGMQRDAEQAPFGGGVDGEIQRRRGLHDTVDDPLHLARPLLQDEHVATADERHPDGLCETGDDRRDREIGIEDRRFHGLALN